MASESKSLDRALPDEIGRRVVMAINGRGTTQSKLAKDSGCHASLISKLSRGLLPSDATLSRVASALGMSFEDLVGSDEVSGKVAPAVQANGHPPTRKLSGVTVNGVPYEDLGPPALPSRSLAEPPLPPSRVEFLIQLGRMVERHNGEILDLFRIYDLSDGDGRAWAEGIVERHLAGV